MGEPASAAGLAFQRGLGIAHAFVALKFPMASGLGAACSPQTVAASGGGTTPFVPPTAS